MINSTILSVIGLTLALVVAACSGDPSGEVKAGDSASQPSHVSPADGSDAPADMGSVTVNGDVYAVTSLNRCEPPDVLDLQARFVGGKINLVGRSEQVTAVSIDGRGVEENYGSIAFGTIDIHESSVAGDRVTGLATLDDSFDTDSTVEVEWDVQIPGEARDCSL